jgi:hypothetical protein
MRQQRQLNREINAVIAPESWLEDWRWNLDADRICVGAKRRASLPVRIVATLISSSLTLRQNKLVLFQFLL